MDQIAPSYQYLVLMLCYSQQLTTNLSETSSTC
uniref:Uncharacterized protein n=1 Tax=Anguilla anguilla TaxID=7936 RepID=A0A0E9PC49_ANGAN